MTNYSTEFTGKILVTGVTGAVGKSTVEHLLKKGVPAKQIVGLSRKTAGTEDLAEKGIELRLGDIASGS